jgi:hypothetical protein
VGTVNLNRCIVNTNNPTIKSQVLIAKGVKFNCIVGRDLIQKQLRHEYKNLTRKLNHLKKDVVEYFYNKVKTKNNSVINRMPINQIVNTRQSMQVILADTVKERNQLSFQNKLLEEKCLKLEKLVYQAYNQPRINTNKQSKPNNERRSRTSTATNTQPRNETHNQQSIVKTNPKKDFSKLH